MKWYKAINKNGKVRKEHRIIMEEELGRPLEVLDGGTNRYEVHANR